MINSHMPLCCGGRKDTCLGDSSLKSQLDVSNFGDFKEALVPRLQGFVILSTGIVLHQCWQCSAQGWQSVSAGVSEPVVCLSASGQVSLFL